MSGAEREALAGIERAFGVRLAFSLLNLTTGEVSGERAHEVTATASTYKLPLLLHVATQVERGALHWAHPLRLGDQHRSWGTGVLGAMQSGLTLTLRDTCRLMIVLSDNTATDMLVELCGLDDTNATLRTLGFRHTRLIPQTSAPDPHGRFPWAAGETTPAEMTGLLRGLLDASFVSATSSRFILDLLGAQQDRSMIPRRLPPGWYYAGKTGSNADLRADIGLLTHSPDQRLALAVYAHHSAADDWTVESVGTLAVAELARTLICPSAASR